MPGLSSFVNKNKYDELSINFSDPKAVQVLNQALLKFFYQIDHWIIPPHYLCPPIPGRADYIHQMADLLGSKNNGLIPKGKSISMLDIGVGANTIYPLIAHREYLWNVVGSDIDLTALKAAQQIIKTNQLDDSIIYRHQPSSKNIFKNIILENDFFDLTVSNPPFHSSMKEAEEANLRKNKNLSKNTGKSLTALKLNFGGVHNELWCDGGEVGFVQTMIEESSLYKSQCFWFSTLISKYTNLPLIYEQLKKFGVREFKTIDMAQGQKKSRVVAWTFLTPKEQKEWQQKQSIL